MNDPGMDAFRKVVSALGQDLDAMMEGLFRGGWKLLGDFQLPTFPWVTYRIPSPPVPYVDFSKPYEIRITAKLDIDPNAGTARDIQTITTVTPPASWISRMAQIRRDGFETTNGEHVRGYDEPHLDTEDSDEIECWVRRVEYRQERTS